MTEESTKLQAFISKLENYKATLEEMNRLTGEEITRLNSLAFSIKDNTDLEEEDTAAFLNQQISALFDKLSSLTQMLPHYSFPKEAFLTDEIKWLQVQALERLKDQSASKKNIS